MPTNPALPRNGTAIVAEMPLLFAIFLDLLGFGMLFPDVQLRAQSYGVPGWLIGLILSSYSLVQMVFSPLWGKWSDHLGAKPVLVLCGALSAVSMVTYALGHSLWAILLSRVVAGFGAANVVVAQAYISATSDGEKDRAAAQARMSAAVSAGLLLGPVVGGFLAHAGGNFLLGITAAVASGLGALWILVAVPAHLPVSSPVAPEGTALPKPQSFLALLREKSGLRHLFIVASIGWFALACLEGTFGRLIHHTRGYGQREFGILLSLEALAGIVPGAFYAAIARRLSGEKLLAIAYGLQALGLSLMPFAPGLAVLTVLSTLFGLGVGLATPTVNGRASALTPPDRQGEVFGLLQSSRACGFLVGPILGGLLFDMRPAAPYLWAGVVLALTAVAVLTRPHKT